MTRCGSASTPRSPRRAGSWPCGTSGKSGLLKDTTYRSFDAETLLADAQSGAAASEVTLNIIETGKAQDYLGVWQFKLKTAD